MNTIKTYFAAILTLLWIAGCKPKEQAVISPSNSAGDIEPDQLKPQLDVRFQEKFFEAQKQMALGNIEKAYSAYQECLTIEPANGAVNYELARIEANYRNNLIAASSFAKKAVEADADNLWYHKLYGDLNLNQGKYDLAIRSYREVLRIDPGSTNAENDLIGAYVSAGKLKEAIGIYDEREKKFGVSEESAIEKHQLYMQLGDSGKAGLELEKLANSQPSNSEYWGMVAYHYQQLGQMDKAAAAFDKLKDSANVNGRVHMQLSEYYAATGDDNKSFAELKLGFQSTDVGIDEKIGVLMRFYQITERDTSMLSRAFELLEITVNTHPSDPKAYSIYGDFQIREGYFVAAATKYRKVIELDPSRSSVWIALMEINQELSDYKTMVTESARAMELFPALPVFYMYNGLASVRTGKIEQAQESLMLGKELVIDDNQLLGRFYALLGEVYHRKGQFEKSDEQFDQALRIAPDNLTILNNYAYFLALRKSKLDKAAEMSKICVARDPKSAYFKDTYAWVLFQQGKYTDALPWIEKAIESSSVPVGEMFEHHGDILFMNGRKSEALNQWKKAREIGGGTDELPRKISEEQLVN